MTSLDKIETTSIGPSSVTAPDNHLAVELTETSRLALPMALTQLGQIAMMTTDLALVGRLGDERCRRRRAGLTVFFVSFTFGMGLVSAVAPLAAQAFGARDPRMVRRALRVGLWAGAPDCAAGNGRFRCAASRSWWRSARRRPPRIWRSNICSVSYGASRRRCGSSPSAASWARSTGRRRCCGSPLSRSRPTPAGLSR